MSYNNNIESSREHIQETEVQTDLLRRSQKRWCERFLKGPIAMREIAVAACLPGKALAVFLTIHHRTALTGKPVVTLPAKLLRELGVSRDAKRRGLKALEQAGLVHVSRSKGKAARIQLKTTKGEINVRYVN
jgi:DNA-binding transcriptional ArsR family regulator